MSNTGNFTKNKFNKIVYKKIWLRILLFVKDVRLKKFVLLASAIKLKKSCYLCGDFNKKKKVSENE